MSRWLTQTLFLICFCLPAYAEAMDSEGLKIIGRGLQNRKTGEVIALACIGPKIAGSPEASCKVLRHVKLLPETKELVYLGDEYHIETVGEPAQGDFKVLVKSINRSVRKHKKKLNEERRSNLIGWMAMLTGGGFGAYVIYQDLTLKAAGAAGLATGPVLLSWLGVMVIIFGTQELAKHPLFAKNGVITNVMADQNGWNWSVKPRKVSPKTYRWLDRYLNRDSDRNYHSKGLPG